MTLDAKSDSSITSTVGAAAVAVSGGEVAAAGSIGVSLARNFIGYDGITDSTGLGNEVLAYINQSTVHALGTISTTAASSELMTGVSFSGSVAVAIGIGGAAAGSGAETTNWIATKTQATATDSELTAKQDIIFKATGDSQVKDSDAVGVAVAVGLGSGSVAASLVDNSIKNDVEAFITASSDKIIMCGWTISPSRPT